MAGTIVIIEQSTDPAARLVHALHNYHVSDEMEYGAVLHAINRHGNCATKPLTGKSIATIVQQYIATHLGKNAT